jgi:hypothetical protein
MFFFLCVVCGVLVSSKNNSTHYYCSRTVQHCTLLCERISSMSSSPENENFSQLFRGSPKMRTPERIIFCRRPAGSLFCPSVLYVLYCTVWHTVRTLSIVVVQYRYTARAWDSHILYQYCTGSTNSHEKLGGGRSPN